MASGVNLTLVFICLIFIYSGVQTSQGTFKVMATTSASNTAPEGDKYIVQSKLPNTTYICIVFEGHVCFDNFTYNTSRGQLVTRGNVCIPFMKDSNVSVSGVCGVRNQWLVVTFYQNWSLVLNFTTNNYSSSTAPAVINADDVHSVNMTYRLRSAVLTYSLDDKHFLNASSPGQARVAGLYNISGNVMSGVSGGGWFKCHAGLTLGLNTGVILAIGNLRYKAFNRNMNTSFSDNDLSQCRADILSESIVPYAVGGALAGLVVIVVTAYVIGRHRSRRPGYESV